MPGGGTAASPPVDTREATPTHSGGAQQREHPNEVRVGNVAPWFPAREQQVHQLVVTEFEQTCECFHVGIVEISFITAEKTFEDQIVFQQAASGTPAKSRAAQRIGLM